eukprot:g10999.t1
MNYVAGLLLLVSHNEDVAKHVIHNPVFGVQTKLGLCNDPRHSSHRRPNTRPSTDDGDRQRDRPRGQDFGLAGFYVGKLPLLRRYLRACESLVADTLPELREHFIKQSVQPAVCARFRGAFDRVGSGCFGATRVKRPSGPKDLV